MENFETRQPNSEHNETETDPEGFNGLESYPRQAARSRRFSCGEPRQVEIVQNGLVFLRSRGPYDPVNCLWFQPFQHLQPGDDQPAPSGLGEEQLLVDPLELLQRLEDGASATELPAAEKSRRERMREQGGGITGYSLSNPLSNPLHEEVTSTHRLVAFALNGMVFVADLAQTTPPRKLETPMGAFDPRISPDGQYVAYVHDGDLHVQHLAGSDLVVAHDDNPHITWAIADFNAAEEFNRFRGFWWSPDSTRLAVTKVDNSNVATWWISDPANPATPPVEHKYPVAGSENATVTLALVGVDGSHTPVELDDTHEYLLAVEWVTIDTAVSDTAESAVLATFLDREQQHRRTYLIGIDGSTHDKLSLRDDRWIELTPGTPRLVGGSIFTVTDLTSSARPSPQDLGLQTSSEDGDRRLLRFESTDQLPLALTPPEWLVENVSLVSKERAIVTVVDRNAGPAYRCIGSVSIDGAVASTLIGGADDLGIHSVAAVSDSFLVARSASLDTDRPIHRLYILRGHTATYVATLQSFAAVPNVEPKPAFLRAGLRQLPTGVFLPSDPLLRAEGTKLPVIMDPYGGPHHAKLLASRSALAASQWLADQGFAVVVVDGRGTPGLGPEFERSIYLDLAGPVLADQVVGLLEAAAMVPQLDLTRVGIRGWSFGGYLAALAVLRRPDVFHCAVVGAPVIDWRLYDTGYTERYLGNPAFDDEPYARASLMDEAASLSRPVQLIHGLADDNVVAANTLRFSSALLAAGVAHEVLPLSGVTHMTSQEEVAENLVKLEVAFLRRHLGQPTFPENRLQVNQN